MYKPLLVNVSVSLIVSGVQQHMTKWSVMTSTFSIFPFEGLMDKMSICTNSIGWLAIIGCKGVTSGTAFLFKQFLPLTNIKSGLFVHAWPMKSFSDLTECSHITLVCLLSHDNDSKPF